MAKASSLRGTEDTAGTPDTCGVAVLTRFSILSHRSAHSWMRFHVGPWTLRRLAPSVFAPVPAFERRKAYLFAPERLEFRLRILERVLLASLANQSDRSFEHFILTSAHLPDWALGRLEGLADAHGSRIVPLGLEDTIDGAMAQQTPTRGAERTVTMRIDDDDAIDRDLVQKTKRIALLCGPDDIISWTNGFELSLPRRGQPVLERYGEPFRSCAMARVTEGPALSPTVHAAGQHHLIADTNVIHCQPDAGAFLMTNHGDNVSGRRQRRASKPLTNADVALLADRFGIEDAHRLRERLFGA